MTKTALYRHFDEGGRLLYVGISLCAFQRTRQHGLTAPWFEDVERIEIEWFAARHEAEGAEWQAIKNEKPIYNKQFNKRPIVVETKEQQVQARHVMVIGDTFMSVAAFKQIAVHT